MRWAFCRKPCTPHLSSPSTAHQPGCQPLPQAKGPAPRILGLLCTPPMLWHMVSPVLGRVSQMGWRTVVELTDGGTGRAGGLPSQGMGSRGRTVSFTSEATTSGLGRLRGWSMLEATPPRPERAGQGRGGDGPGRWGAQDADA